MYQLLENSDYIKKLEPQMIIPPSMGNIDYLTYLKWIEEGNTPLPATHS
jgi:hypothetical protein